MRNADPDRIAVNNKTSIDNVLRSTFDMNFINIFRRYQNIVLAFFLVKFCPNKPGHIQACNLCTERVFVVAKSNAQFFAVLVKVQL